MFIHLFIHNKAGTTYNLKKRKGFQNTLLELKKKRIFFFDLLFFKHTTNLVIEKNWVK